MIMAAGYHVHTAYELVMELLGIGYHLTDTVMARRVYMMLLWREVKKLEVVTFRKDDSMFWNGSYVEQLARYQRAGCCKKREETNWSSSHIMYMGMVDRVDHYITWMSWKWCRMLSFCHLTFQWREFFFFFVKKSRPENTDRNWPCSL